MADRRLKIFHTVARVLNFTKAGEQLHMTQPAFTFQTAVEGRARKCRQKRYLNLVQA